MRDGLYTIITKEERNLLKENVVIELKLHSVKDYSRKS